MHSNRRIVISSILAAVGALVALMAAFCGYAAAADYHLVLWRWAVFTVIATVFLGVSIFIGNKWVRWAAIPLLAITWLAGVEPAERLIRLYSN